MIWAGIKRGVAIFFGFIAGVLVAMAVIFWLGSRWAAQEIAAQGQGPADPALEGLYDLFGAAAFVLTVAPGLTLIPALAAVIIGEVVRIRSLLYYVVAGGLAAALMPVVAGPPDAAQGAVPSGEYVAIMATAGFAAGLVYWLIAGRNA